MMNVKNQVKQPIQQIISIIGFTKIKELHVECRSNPKSPSVNSIINKMTSAFQKYLFQTVEKLKLTKLFSIQDLPCKLC